MNAEQLTALVQKLEEAIIAFQPDLIYERSEYLQDKGVAVIKKHKIKYFLEIKDSKQSEYFVHFMMIAMKTHI